MYGAEGKAIMASREYMEHLAKQRAENKLEVLGDDSEFVNECVQCGNCCRNRDDILLTPYDLFHMVRGTGKSIKEVIVKYGDCYIGDSSHLPLVRLKYREEPDGTTTCYFLGRRDGKHYCRIHDNKPGVCRIFPLGKFLGRDLTKEGTPDFAPKYFCQEYSPMDPCPGRKLAMKSDIRKKVVDWVGGAEKKRLSDRYSETFNRFLEDYNKTLDFKKLDKRWDPLTQSFFFALVGAKIYEDYDFTVSDEEFLDQMAFNFNQVIELIKTLNKNPKYLLRIMAENSQNNDVKTKAEETTA